MKRLILVLWASVIAVPAHSSTDEQKEIVGRAAQELNVILEMLEEAKRLQAPGDVEAFDFTGSQMDILLIQKGLQDHVDGRRDLTYKRKPLVIEKGSY